MSKKLINENSLYLDACATTPLHPEVINDINQINSNIFGNASSIHEIGVNAATVLEFSRIKIADKLNCCPENIIFVSGATESIHLAIKGASKKLLPGRIVISSIEHPAVNYAAKSLEQEGWVLEYWPVDDKGNLLLDKAEDLLSFPTKIVSIIWGQSEIGTINPIKIIGEKCRAKNIIFHTDATQLIPNSLINFNELPIDLLSASAHKFQGPKGVGLLLHKELVSDLCQLQGGGNQEYGFRSGTEPISLISGMKTAISKLQQRIVISNSDTIFLSSKVKENTQRLLEMLVNIEGVELIGNSFNKNRLPNLISLLLKGKCSYPISGREMVRKLSNRGIYASSGSACSSNSSNGSEILKAIGIDSEYAGSGIRISLGSWIKTKDLDNIYQIFKEEYKTFNR